MRLAAVHLCAHHALLPLQQVTQLEPLPTANLVKWRQQVRWYTAPLEQIVVKEEGIKTLADGTEVEVMMDTLREDVRTDLPHIRSADDQQQALFARFQDVEWTYVKPPAPAAGGATDPSVKWWRKVPQLKDPGGALSERWENELAYVVAWCTAKLLLMRQINDRCLDRMGLPAGFIDSLPKHAKVSAPPPPLRNGRARLRVVTPALGGGRAVVVRWSSRSRLAPRDGSQRHHPMH